jgi:hypothetical protein
MAVSQADFITVFPTLDAAILSSLFFYKRMSWGFLISLWVA